MGCGAAKEEFRAWATASLAAFCAMAVRWAWGRGYGPGKTGAGVVCEVSGSA